MAFHEGDYVYMLCKSTCGFYCEEVKVIQVLENDQYIIKDNDCIAQVVKYGILHAYDYKCIKRAEELNYNYEPTEDELYHYGKEDKEWSFFV